MSTVTSAIENGFVHLPDKAAWLDEYLHELASFPNGKYDDQADSTSQALDWFKQHGTPYAWFIEFGKRAQEGIKAAEHPGVDAPVTRGALLRELANFPFGRY